MNQAKVLQLMMTTQAVNHSPEIYGQDYNGLPKKRKQANNIGGML